MTGQAGKQRPGSIPLRLSAMLVLALLPLAVLAILQTSDMARQAEKGLYTSALSQTVEAAAPETRAIRDAQTAAATLASAIAPYVDDPAACRQMVEGLARQMPDVSLVAYTPMSGRMTCASGGHSYDFAGSPLFQDLTSAAEPRMVVNPHGPVSGTSVLGISHPVLANDGTQIGIVSLSIPQQALVPAKVAADAAGLGQPDALITFDGQGRVLTASTGLVGVDGVLPASRPLGGLIAQGFQTFADLSADGGRRVYAAVPIAGNLGVLGVWTAHDDGALFHNDLVPYLYPLLMCLAGLTVATLGVERLVTRHIRSLARSMRAYARGSRAMPAVALDHPPAEIAALADTYRRMTDTLRQDEAELENLLRQKQDLLREVHHRTGNSLQLIASILRLHLREDPDEGVRRVLEGVLERVLGLSTVHLGLYRLAGQSDIAMDALIGEVVGKVRPILERPGRVGRIKTDLHPLTLPSQQAVPLALLLAEVLSLFQGSLAEDEAPVIHVGLDSPEPLTARLTLCGPAGAHGALSGQAEGGPAIIAARLIRSFVQQLDGDLQVSRGPAVTQAVLTFAIRHVEQATERGAEEGAPRGPG
ncbi:sensor histidine kinase [Rhodobacter sp. Har01]|uniref:sensor histidine kinase n=1 Tax=Rhodobacter sp. Har01 TaxID=2883999 RepID=UPI001D098A63|nr:sensor histidine kinase [Rhodobacter sp. Har01]MCB6176583.1 sensor histidine kinase [Rhodobacter sp. Har01]